MDTHRFGETKINLDTLSRHEVTALNVYAHQRLGRALGEVAMLNQFMNEHNYYGVKQAYEFGEPMATYEHDSFGDLPEAP